MRAGEGGGGGDSGQPMYYGVAAVQSDGCEGGRVEGRGGQRETALQPAIRRSPRRRAWPAQQAGRSDAGAAREIFFAAPSARRDGGAIARVRPRLRTTAPVGNNNVGCTERDPSARGRCNGQAGRGRATGETAASI